MAKQRESRWVKWVVSRIVRIVLWLVTKPEWKGTEHVPAQGGAIIATNHLSVTDPLTVAHFLYIGARRWPTFTMKDGVMKIPVVRSVARSTGQIPVKRGGADAVKALGEAEKALVQDGSSVIFYPEGTCTRDPHLWPMTAKNGVARLALSTGVPVVPVAHWGEQHILPYGEKKPRLLPPRKRVQFTAGPPVDLAEFRDQPITATVLDEATRRIMADITALQAEIRGEQPPAEPFDFRKARKERAAVERGEPATDDQGAAAETERPAVETTDGDNGKNDTGA
ncbi:1-acyl-sn-glycerol-3-phosphate acyltransferase [Nocardiopsis sp. MG754419]|uniref:lysophospholipid acyltransferase family protein n=1 Tax=Nocardiopsis sp. MG754419 TaxID=2259865 RepID=UPI001BA75514|nr:lysophospholipid acyltransferase family protein [Nocardiopsis sp. MG754419]MBR8740509.1 1-acyl-sn-glycerol-3-phosphate acyltransferase [Nocardiopsis sp. MG754419]